MEKNKKIALIIGGIALLGTGIGLAIYFSNQKRKEEEEAKELEEALAKDRSANSPIPQGNSAPTGWDAIVAVGQNNTSNPTISDRVTPTFNRENELSNPYSEIKGQILYPKAKGENGGFGFANIRTSAEVNNDRGWWDFSDNFLTKISAGTPIGKVVSEVTGTFNGYGYRWFKVWLMHKVGFWGTTHGYVRGDNVTFKPYSK